jgi:hypothetical protein
VKNAKDRCAVVTSAHMSGMQRNLSVVIARRISTHQKHARSFGHPVIASAERVNAGCTVTLTMRLPNTKTKNHDVTYNTPKHTNYSSPFASMTGNHVALRVPDLDEARRLVGREA